MLIESLDYELPPELVATRPAGRRQDARLMVVSLDGGAPTHHSIADLPTLLRRGDLLVRNDSAVLAARLLGHRAKQGLGRGGGRVQGLFLEVRGDGTWRVLLESGGRLQVGERIDLSDDLHLTLVERSGHGWITAPSSDRPAAELLEACGHTPLPPYILNARRRRGEQVDDADDRRWYSTTFANTHARGSVAAPTAGLHLTPALDEALGQAGIETLAITLHVGEGTFRSVETETLEAHRMHSEAFSVRPAVIDRLHRGPNGDGRLIALGTTTTRLLESLPDPLPQPQEGASMTGETDLCIAPGHRWRHVEGLLTNFHLPRSTLLALVAALVGLERLHELYREAIDQRYRFFSYGDAMLILP